MQIVGATPTGSGVKIHTFPTPFIEAPWVVYSAQCHDISTSTYIAYVDSITRSGFRYTVKSHDNVDRIEGVRYIATGRWK